MTSPRIKDLALAVVRIALGVLFAWAALTKLPNMELFAEETANYRMLPASLVSLFAVCVAGVEVLSSALLILGIAARAAASVIAVLLVAFIVALSQALLRGIDLRCGCFGGAELASWGTVARDVAMLGFCVPLVLAGGGRLLPQRKAASLRSQ